MGKLWSRYRDADGASRLCEENMAQLKIEKPTVIFLSGFLTTNDQPGFIAGALKRLEDLFAAHPELDKPERILAWSHSNLKNIFNLMTYQTRPQGFASEAGFQLAKAVIMPLVTDDTGARLSIADAQKNLNNVTFVAYSAGTVVAQEVYNASFRLMKQAGFAKHEIRQILNTPVLISTGSISRPSQEKNRFTTLYLVASNDRIVRFKNRLMSPSLKAIFAWFSQKLDIRPLSKQSIFATAAVKRTMFETVETKDGTKQPREIQKLYPKWMMRSSYHELPHYLTTDDTQSPFARMAFYAIANAVVRTELLSPFDLLKPPAKLSADARYLSAYQKRVHDAIDARSFKQRWQARALELKKTLNRATVD